MEENKQNRKDEEIWYYYWKQTSCELENRVIRPVDRKLPLMTGIILESSHLPSLSPPASDQASDSVMSKL